MPNLTRQAPYYTVKRVIRQPDSHRRYGTLPKSPRHSGLGITLSWLNCNLFYQNDRVVWSATCSDESLQKAAGIDAEVIADLNAAYKLDDPLAAPASYDVNVLFNIVRRVCLNPRYALGFTIRLPQSNQIGPISDLHRLMVRRSNFMGIVLRLHRFSATSGTIGIWKTLQGTKVFVPSTGEYTVPNDVLLPFINYMFLSSLEAPGGFSSACIFKADPLVPISKQVTDEVAGGPGIPGSYRSL